MAFKMPLDTHKRLGEGLLAVIVASSHVSQTLIPSNVYYHYLYRRQKAKGIIAMFPRPHCWQAGTFEFDLFFRRPVACRYLIKEIVDFCRVSANSQVLSSTMKHWTLLYPRHLFHPVCNTVHRR